MIPGTRTALGQVLGINRTPTEADPRLGGFTLTDEGQVILDSAHGGWYPSDLFLNGEQGGLWDFTDLSNLYQDSAGTTPVTAVGQPIGLALDTKNGTPIALGPELVTNGDFSDGTTGWIAGGTQNVVSGELEVSGAAATKWSYQVVTTVVGKAYQVGGTRRGGTGSAIVWAGTASGSNSLGVTATTPPGGSASTQLIFTATTTTTFIQLLSVGAGQTAYFDNISIREIPGNHLTQATSTKRPLLGRMPATGVRNNLVNTDVLSTQNVTVNASQCVLSFTGTGTITKSGVATGALVGTGASDRVYETFTPTAGTLTLTVTGSVTLAQLEYVA